MLLVNAAMIIFMILPIFIVVWMSFTPYAYFALPTNNFSLRWYVAAIEHQGFRDSLLLSLKLALVSSLASSVLSFLAAYAIARSKSMIAAALDGFFLSPLIIPHVVLGIALLQFVNSIGLFNSFGALVAAHVIITAPFIMRFLVAAMRQIPIELEWAARNLGAGSLAIMRRVVLPACGRSLFAGALFAFIISFDEVVITIFVAGPSQQTLPIRIYGYLSDQFDPIVAAMSAMLVVFSCLVVVALERLGGLRDVVE
jgi:putative spermidine/putrescine transport system permease protein